MSPPPQRVPTVMVQLGAETVRAAVPEADVVEVPFSGPVDDTVSAPVLFGAPIWGPTLEELLERGVIWFHVAGTGVERLPGWVYEGRTVTCARGVAAVPIAEFCLAAMLAYVKDLPASWLHEPADQHAMASLGELRGQTLGLVGLGGIGSELARMGQAMGMRVLALRRSDAPGPEGVEVVGTLEDLLPEADHLVLAAPETSRTHHLMDAAAFGRCKAGAHLVNIARGSLVDHDALLVALDEGTIGRATLDVTDPEPLPADHPLFRHRAAKISAHVSWSSPRAMERMVGCFVDNLRRFVAGEPLAGVVEPSEGY